MDSPVPSPQTACKYSTCELNMTQKRPCDDEIVNDAPLKHRRFMKEVDHNTPHLEFIPSKETSEKFHISENHLDGEEIATHGYSAVYPEGNKDNDAEVPSSLSLSPWETSSTSEEDERRDIVVRLPFSPEYFSFDRPLRSPLRGDDLYRSLFNYPPRKSVPVGPEHQADVPELSEKSSITDQEDELAGICIVPRSQSEPPQIDESTVGVGRRDCSCEDIGSIRCVRQHIMEAREKLMTTLGFNTFTELGFCEMGEVVADKWSQEEEILFHKAVYCNPMSSGKNFWNALYAVLPSRSKMEIVSYYFNVFMLRKRAEQNRYDPRNIDSDNDEWQIEDDDDGFNAAEKSDEEDDSGIESPLCHEGDVHGWHPGSLNEHSKEFIDEKDLSCKVDEKYSENHTMEKIQYDDSGYHDGFCTSSDSGAPQITHENPDSGKEWHGSILDPCDAKAWNGYSRCSKDELDFLPTCSMIKEVFGDGSLDSQTKSC